MDRGAERVVRTSGAERRRGGRLTALIFGGAIGAVAVLALTDRQPPPPSSSSSETIATPTTPTLPASNPEIVNHAEHPADQTAPVASEATPHDHDAAVAAEAPVDHADHSAGQAATDASSHQNHQLAPVAGSAEQLGHQHAATSTVTAGPPETVYVPAPPDTVAPPTWTPGVPGS